MYDTFAYTARTPGETWAKNSPGVRIHVVRISCDTSAIVERHSRDDSRDKIGNFGHLLLSHDGHANVAQQSNDSYA